jgi:hypothetical protein
MKLEELHERLVGMEAKGLPKVLIKTVVRMTNCDPAKRLCSVHTAEAMLKLPAFCCRECAASLIAAWKKRVEKTCVIIYRMRVLRIMSGCLNDGILRNGLHRNMGSIDNGCGHILTRLWFGNLSRSHGYC